MALKRPRSVAVAQTGYMGAYQGAVAICLDDVEYTAMASRHDEVLTAVSNRR
jgi:hypothetical protein